MRVTITAEELGKARGYGGPVPLSPKKRRVIKYRDNPPTPTKMKLPKKTLKGLRRKRNNAKTSK
jgi:hypothetical protein